MANMKFVCRDCGAFAVQNEHDVRPNACHFCKGWMRREGIIINLNKPKTPYSGKSFNELKNVYGDMPYLGAGVDRVAFALDNEHVLKVAHNTYKRRANEKEVKAYHKASPTLKPYLCPIVDWADDYEWVVMRRATQIGYNGKAFPPVVYDNIGDLHHGNVGLVDNKLVVLDYVGGGVGG